MDTKVLIVYGIIAIVLVGVFFGVKFLRKRFKNRIEQQKTLVDQHKRTISIFVIEKKKAKITDANMPKMVVDQIPAIYKLKKMPLITAKVGPQIVTLLCEDKIYDQIPDKKNVTVDIAGIFIAAVKAMPTSKKKRK